MGVGINVGVGVGSGVEVGLLPKSFEEETKRGKLTCTRGTISKSTIPMSTNRFSVVFKKPILPKTT
jgi:hypothetical protein